MGRPRLSDEEKALRAEQRAAAEGDRDDAERMEENSARQAEDSRASMKLQDTMTPVQKKMAEEHGRVRTPENFPDDTDKVFIYSKLRNAFTVNTGLGYAIRLPAGVPAPRLDSGPNRVCGFSVSNYPRKVWEAINKIYSRTSQFKRQHIFMAENRDSGDARARELEGIRTGLEGFDPRNPPASIGGIATYDGKK